MKNKNIKYSIIILFVTFMISVYGCEERITDYGFDGQISGQILDQNGNPVSGDITTASFTVFALGEEEREPIQMRVQGDGTYANLHMYPQSYTVWVEGPIDAPGEQIVDLSGNAVEHNITVTPYLTIPEPSNANISADELTVSYEITENASYEAEARIIFVSTVSYPNANTGNGPYWKTRQQILDDNSGSVTVTLDSDLIEDARNASDALFIRVAARAEGTNEWNYSEQISIDAP